MKKNLLIVILLSSVVAFSQSSESELNTIYYESIKNHIDNLKNDISKGSTTIKLEDLYFISEDVPIKYLPERIGSYKINYLNIYEKKNIKLLKKGIDVVSITSFDLKGNEIIVNLVDFGISYKNKNYDFINRGGSTSVFKYSCSDNKWLPLETKISGI